MIKILFGQAPKRAVFTTVSILLLLAGCATTIKNLYHDPSFTYDAIQASGLQICGVISAVSDLGREEMQTYSEHLMIQLAYHEKGFASDIVEAFTLKAPKDRTPDLRVNEAKVVVEALGRKRYYAMLNDYKYRTPAFVQWLEEIGSKTGARYAVFARIEKQTPVHRKRVKHVDYRERGKDKNGKEQEKVAVGQHISSETTIQADVVLEIYDLSSKTVVWSGPVSGYGVNSKSYHTKRVPDDDKGIPAETLKMLDDQLYPFPPDPTLADALWSAFKVYAENLPKPPKK
jgi:hypothetical protein